MADTYTSSSLFTFIDEETDTIIALTGGANELEKMAGGKGATISVDCTVILWGTAYTVSDILINMTNQPNRFLPEEYDGMALGEAFDYTISVRLMVHEQ